jgi:tetratricopeptide (TPR) repeat protein
MTKSPTREAISPLVGLWIRLDQPELGEAIALLRKYFGLTRSELLRRMWDLSPEQDLGVDESLIYRWERGEKGKSRTLPGTRYRALLGRVCDNEVGGLSQSSRREFLGKLAAVGGPSMFFSFTGMEFLMGSTHWTASPQALEQVVGALSNGNAFDMTADHVGQITALYEYLRRRIPGAQLIGAVRGHVDFIAQYLRENSLTASSRAELVSALGQASVLAGILSFWDMQDEPAGRHFFEAAGTAAREANDNSLAAYALGFTAELESYLQHSARAIELSRAAQEAAHSLNSPRIRGWLSAVEALASAPTDRASVLRTLERARNDMASTKPSDPDPHWIKMFDPTRLESYAGDILLKSGHAPLALVALQQADAGTDPALKRDRAEIAADTAWAFAQTGEVEESCRHLATSFDLASSLKYRDGFRRVLNVRQQLNQWNDGPAVKELDERLRFGWAR